MYTTPLTAVIEKHCIRHEMFADDTQLSHYESPDNYSDLVCSLQDCVKDIGQWTEENKFKLNSDKTEAIRFSTSSSVNIIILLPHTITLSDTLELSATLASS